MIARNMTELEKMLKNDLIKQMGVIAKKVEADMYEETAGFYTQGNPELYQRTGALGDTPRTTAPASGVDAEGNPQVSIQAYLDTNCRYTTGVNPSMEDVLNLANSGVTKSSEGKFLKPTLGKKHFWEGSLKKMEKTYKQTLRKHYKIYRERKNS